MLDLKRLRHHFSEIESALRRRGFILDAERWFLLENQRKILDTKTQDLQAQRNILSKKIGILKSQGTDDTQERQKAHDIFEELLSVSKKLADIKEMLLDFQNAIPNVPDDSVPNGSTERDNVVHKICGVPRVFNFKPKDHLELGEQKGWIHPEKSAQLSGARFMVLSGSLAHLHRALSSWMLDVHTQEHGYEEAYVPYMVHAHCLFGTGQLPKFREDQFAIQGTPELFLIPTAEVPLTNLYREQILHAHELPICRVAATPCFRREAGSYGKDTRGIMRQHQFEKVELIQIVEPKYSDAALETLTANAERILQLLELPYRVLSLCAGDLGFTAKKTYDLEVFLPGQNAYREISSCSNCGDFQARRMHLRYRSAHTRTIEFPHTLNGSGVAVGRALLAVLENYQTEQGDVVIPKVLRPYMNNKNVLDA